MSLFQVNRGTPSSKALSGCGDGIRNGHHQDKSFKKPIVRPPVPSCRRFATRMSPENKSTGKDVKVQLQNAIEKLAANPNITRRRALTMAEITPTRSGSKKPLVNLAPLEFIFKSHTVELR